MNELIIVVAYLGFYVSIFSGVYAADKWRRSYIARRRFERAYRATRDELHAAQRAKASYLLRLRDDLSN